MRSAALVLTVMAFVGGSVSEPASAWQSGKPETFRANAQVTGPTGTAAAMILITINRFTHEKDRATVEGALKGGGYPGFLLALRNAPDVGFVQHGTDKYAIRYARETKTDKGRTILLVTEKPVVFVGGAAPNAKSREGYEVAVLQLNVDDIGFGSGSMAGAARVRLNKEGIVELDDYAEQPIKLLTVTRQVS